MSDKAQGTKHRAQGDGGDMDAATRGHGDTGTQGRGDWGTGRTQDPDPARLLTSGKARDWRSSRTKAGLRGRLRWLVPAAVMLAVVAYLTGLIGDHTPQGPVEPVVEGPSPIVSASGSVVPERRARLSFTTGGRVQRLAVKPGDVVKRGQLLAQLEPSTLQSGGLGGSAPPAPGVPDLYIVAPFDGTVGLTPFGEWETVAPGSPVVLLGDLSSLRVEIEDLSETDVGRLQVGQSAEISFDAFPGRKAIGQVTRVSPMSNAKGGGVNYDVVVEFRDRELPALRWGMTAHVDIQVVSER